MADRVFCPFSKEVGVCRQEVKPLHKGDSPTFIVCGCYSEVAGRCSFGLLADGLRALNEKADRLAGAAEAIYAVMDPEDDV